MLGHSRGQDAPVANLASRINWSRQWIQGALPRVAVGAQPTTSIYWVPTIANDKATCAHYQM